MANRCKNCGQKLEDNDIFCDNCGAKLVEDSSPANIISNNANDNSQQKSSTMSELMRMGKMFTGIFVVSLVIVVFVIFNTSDVVKNEGSRNNSSPPSTVSEDLREVERYIKVGDEQVEFDNFVQAADCYRKAIELNPNPKSDKGYFNLGLAYFNLGTTLFFYDSREKWKSEILDSYRNAVAAFQKAVEINPKYAEGYLKLGVAYFRLGDALLFFDPKNLSEADNNFRNVIPAYQKAIEINPKYAETYYHMAVYYLNLKNYDEAIKNINEAIEIDPSNSDYQTLYQGLLQLRNWAR